MNDMVPNETETTLSEIIDALASQHLTWWKLRLAFIEYLDNMAGTELPDEILPVAELDDAHQAARLALCYIAAVSREGRPRFDLEPFSRNGDTAWPPPPSEVPTSIAEHWPQLADAVTAPAPKGQLHAACFLRGGPNRHMHAAAAAAAYQSAASTVPRQSERIDYLAFAVRLLAAIGDRQAAAVAHGLILDFIEDEIAGSAGGLGFAVKGLKAAIVDPYNADRVKDVALSLSAACRHFPMRDKVMQIRIRLAPDGDRTELIRERIELHAVEARATDHPAVKSLRLQAALQLAQASGQTDLREQLSAELQACAKEDLGLIQFSATSHLYDEAVEELVNQLIGGTTWADALRSFALAGPFSGEEHHNRKLIEDRHEASPLAALLPVQLVGPDGLPSYSGVDPQDRFEVDLVGWEAQMILTSMRLLAQALHEIPLRHGTPPIDELFNFLRSWPSLDQPSPEVLTLALCRFWAGDSDGTTYTTVPHIEGQIRRLVMSQDRGVFRAQQEHKPGQSLGLGALLPILAETHDLSPDWSRYYFAALSHPAGINLRNQLMHGFYGTTEAATAALAVHLLLHLGTLQPRPEATPTGKSSTPLNPETEAPPASPDAAI